MNLKFFGIAALLLAGSQASAQVSRPDLRCTIPAARPGGFDGLVQPASPEEAARMREDPHGARRISQRLIEIHWIHGVRTFTNKPPYDEPLDGISWTYCGYDSALGLHLIGEQNVDVFTGVLLDDKNGMVLPAGEEVRFSPDRSRYLALEQPDGQDGPTLKVYQNNGRLIWKGYGGILMPDSVSVLADFVSAGWNSDNHVTMKVVLPDKQQKIVTLTHEDGRWQWLPKLTP